MSYILDALKKSEKKRTQGMVSDLPGSKDAILKGTGKRPLWTYMIMGALMINVVALVLWFEPWHSRKTVLPVAQLPADKQSLAIEMKPAYATAKIEGKEAGEKHEIKTKAALEKTAQADRMKVAQEIAPPLPRHSQESPNVQTELKPEVSNIIPNPAPDKIYNLSELPLPLQQKLPAFVISAYIYSDEPNSRMVKINGKIRKEGQDIQEGVKLEEIKPDGIVLNYLNYLFRVGLK